MVWAQLATRTGGNQNAGIKNRLSTRDRGKTRLNLLLSIAPTVLFAVYGQLITRWRVREIAQQIAPEASRMSRARRYLGDPYILSGYGSAVAGSLAWFFVMEQQPLAVAFPVYVGATVLLVALASVQLFGESLTASRVIGMVLIIAGIALGAR